MQSKPTKPNRSRRKSLQDQCNPNREDSPPNRPRFQPESQRPNKNQQNPDGKFMKGVRNEEMGTLQRKKRWG